jgi:hypothetical protein
LPQGFLPSRENDNEWKELMQEAVVYFVTQSLLAVELNESNLKDWDTFRTTLIQA